MLLRCPHCSATVFWAARANQVIAERVRWFVPRPFVCSSCGTKLKQHRLRIWVWPFALLLAIGFAQVLAQPLSQALDISKETLGVLGIVVIGVLILGAEALLGYEEA